MIPDDIDGDRIFFECRHASMGLSAAIRLDYIVMVDAVAYYRMPYKDKYQVAKALGALNWHFRDSGKKLMLFVPGRIGTSSPELGVPTAFSDISSFAAICEVSESRAGYMPELSYGSHIFQDLVEENILYGAVFENEKTLCFAPEKVTRLGNQLTDFLPEEAALANILGIYDVSGHGCFVYHDMKAERLLCVIDPDGQAAFPS